MSDSTTPGRVGASPAGAGGERDLVELGKGPAVDAVQQPGGDRAAYPDAFTGPDHLDPGRWLIDQVAECGAEGIGQRIEGVDGRIALAGLEFGQGGPGDAAALGELRHRQVSGGWTGMRWPAQSRPAPR